MSRKKKPPQPPAPPLERALKSLREQVAESQCLAREHGASMSGFRISVDGDEAEALVVEIDRLQGDVRHLKDREQSIITACERVADGGQYRADIVSAIERIRRQRDERGDLLREFVEVAKANEFLMDLSLLVRAQEALK